MSLFILLSDHYKGLFALFSLLIPVLIVASFNYALDRWGVYSEDSIHFLPDSPPNRLYLKTHFILDNPSEYDCLLFGSSRVDVIDVRLAEDSCYNFTHSAGDTGGHLAALRRILTAGVPIKSVYIGLDDVSYLTNPLEGDRQYQRISPPNSLFDWLAFHARYLLHMPNEQDVGLFLKRSSLIKNKWWVVEPNIHLDTLKAETQKIQSQLPVHREKFLAMRAKSFGQDYYIEEALDNIANIIQLTAEHNVKVNFHINPFYYRTYLNLNHWHFHQFLRGLSQLTDFNDFSGLSSYSLDSRYWYETSHFTTEIGDIIAERLFLAKDNGFGYRVTADNIEKVIQHKLDIAAKALFSEGVKETLIGIPSHFGNYLSSQALSSISLNKDVLDVKGLVERGDFWQASSVDPQINILPNCQSSSQAALIKVDMEVLQSGKTRLYFKRSGQGFSGKRSAARWTARDGDIIYYLLRANPCLFTFRFDPFPGEGVLRMNSIELFLL